MQKEVERFGKKDNITLYLDSPQSVEKSVTAETRESKRQKTIEKLSDCLDTFETRIDEGSRIRKHHYNNIKKDLSSSFYWSLDFTKRDIAHEACLSLIESQHIRHCRRKQLQEAYNSFRARSEERFWAERALLVSSAIVAKKSAVMIQKAGLLEVGSGLQRYPFDLNSNVYTFEY